MKNEEIIEFIDGLNYGKEMFLTFKETKYFIQGWWEQDQAHLVFDYAEPSDNPNCLWMCSSKQMSDCAEAFLEAKLWAGKAFSEVESEIVWTDC